MSGIHACVCVYCMCVLYVCVVCVCVVRVCCTYVCVVCVCCTCVLYVCVVCVLHVRVLCMCARVSVHVCVRISIYHRVGNIGGNFFLQIHKISSWQKNLVNGHNSQLLVSKTLVNHINVLITLCMKTISSQQYETRFCKPIHKLLCVKWVGAHWHMGFQSIP